MLPLCLSAPARCRASSRARLRTAVSVATALVAVVAAIAASPGPASAAVPGLQVVSAHSAYDSHDGKSAIATCPAGKKLIGSGGQITLETGEVVIDDMRPNSTLTSVTLTGFEADDYGASWNIWAYAICADPLPGLLRVRTSSAYNSTDGKSATAACPAGKKLTGTGGELTGALGEVVMDDVRPNSTLTAVTVTGFEADPYAGNWSVAAYAICADPLPGLVRVTTSSAYDSVATKDATATCPAGTRLTGTGGELTGATGEAVMNRIWPSGDQQTRANDVLALEEDPFTGPWKVTSYAVCAQV